MTKIFDWLFSHWMEVSIIASMFVAIGQKAHRMWPGIPQKFPRLEALLELCCAIWPDIERALPAIGKLLLGRIVPPFVVLLLLGCSGVHHTPAQNARIGVETLAHAVALADGAVAVAIRHDSSVGMDRVAVLTRWEPIVDAMEATRQALVIAESVSDNPHWSACDTRDALLIVESHASELSRLLRAVGIQFQAQHLAIQVRCTDGGTH